VTRGPPRQSQSPAERETVAGARRRDARSTAAAIRSVVAYLFALKDAFYFLLVLLTTTSSLLSILDSFYFVLYTFIVRVLQ